MRRILTALVILVNVFMFAACTQPDTYGGRSGWMHNGWGMMGYGGGYLIWILFAVLVIIVIMLATRRQGSDSSLFGPEEERPLDVLKKRYARGEITKEEFDRIKRDIS